MGSSQATHSHLFTYGNLPAVRRRRPGLIDDGPQKRQPVLVIHADQTTPDAFVRFHKHLPPKDPAHPRRGRFQTMNLWRPISHPAIDSPLAICDYRSVNVDEDLLPATLIYAAREGDIYYAKYNPKHRWVYKSDMDTADLVLMKRSLLRSDQCYQLTLTWFQLRLHSRWECRRVGITHRF